MLDIYANDVKFCFHIRNDNSLYKYNYPVASKNHLLLLATG